MATGAFIKRLYARVVEHPFATYHSLDLDGNIQARAVKMASSRLSRQSLSSFE